MKRNLAIVAFLGMLTIVLGAFGAHALKEQLTVSQLQSFGTATRYQMYHIIVLLFVNTYAGFSSKVKNSLTMIFLLGILLFSGSIYAITVASIPAKKIWFVTPLGGLLFIVGWGMLFFQFLKKKE